ncbi:MAG: hypothetical protein PF489_05680 [Salinivirgaceae bacterium]|nr:hypothetical protein [Salinivirgaceae bacterium]
MRSILLIIGIVTITACNTNKEGDNVKKALHDEVVTSEVKPEFKSSRMVYRVPTPIEFFRFYQDGGGRYNAELLLPVNGAAHYISSKEKAVAFGLFASDLAFCAVFAKNQQTISLFETTKQIADELGLTAGYGESLMKRFKDNLDNVDSLYHLSTESYWKVFSFLEEQNKTRLLSYITVAGWIESLYLAINAQSVENSDKLKACIADQQYVIENLVSYLTSVHGDEASNDDVFHLVFELNDVYINLYENPEDVISTEEQFNELQKVITRQRAVLVK